MNSHFAREKNVMVCNYKSVFSFAAAFPVLAPILSFLGFGIFDPAVIKFFMDVTEAACKMRKEEGDNKASMVRPASRYYAICRN